MFLEFLRIKVTLHVAVFVKLLNILCKLAVLSYQKWTFFDGFSLQVMLFFMVAIIMQ